VAVIAFAIKAGHDEEVAEKFLAELCVKGLLGLSEQYERVLGEVVCKHETPLHVRLADKYADGLPEDVQGRIFEMAYDNGHAYGEDEVEIHYESFANLAKGAYEAGVEDSHR
jgi:hypothetical protein